MERFGSKVPCFCHQGYVFCKAFASETGQPSPKLGDFRARSLQKSLTCCANATSGPAPAWTVQSTLRRLSLENHSRSPTITKMALDAAALTVSLSKKPSMITSPEPSYGLQKGYRSSLISRGQAPNDCRKSWQWERHL